MPFDVQRPLRLWTDPLPDDAAASAAFREVYTDLVTVTVNGASLTATALVRPRTGDAGGPRARW
jgi:hypothetical protein